MRKIKGNYSKTLETERLILRKYNKDDFRMLFKNYVSDKNVPRYCTWKPCKTQEEADKLLELWYKGYENPEKLMWMIVEKASGQGIGIIRVTHKWLEENKCEIGYSMGSKWWNKGYMTETVITIIKFLIKEIGFYTIVADVSEDNIGSRRVLEKAGFTLYEKQDGTLYYKYTLKEKIIDYFIKYNIMTNQRRSQEIQIKIRARVKNFNKTIEIS